MREKQEFKGGLKMGFSTGNYMTVWNVEPSENGKYTRVCLSSNRRDMSGEGSKCDFYGFAYFYGNANMAARDLKPKDKIKLVSCDVTNEKTRLYNGYTFYKVFDFEPVDKSSNAI